MVATTLTKLAALATADVLHHPFKNRFPSLAWTGDIHPHGIFKQEREGEGAQCHVILLPLVSIPSLSFRASQTWGNSRKLGEEPFTALFPDLHVSLSLCDTACSA